MSSRNDGIFKIIENQSLTGIPIVPVPSGIDVPIECRKLYDFLCENATNDGADIIKGLQSLSENELKRRITAINNLDIQLKLDQENAIQQGISLNLISNPNTANKDKDKDKEKGKEKDKEKEKVKSDLDIKKES